MNSTAIRSMSDFALAINEVLGADIDDVIDTLAATHGFDLAEDEKATCAADFFDAVTQADRYPDGYISTETLAAVAREIDILDIMREYA